SGGERQRVAIARALVRASPILILDEPTNGLDPETREAVMAAIQKLSRSTTTLLITHDMELARQASKIVALAPGRVVGVGSHAELAASCPEFRRLVSSRNGDNNVITFPLKTLDDHTQSRKIADTRVADRPEVSPIPRLAPDPVEIDTLELARKTSEPQS